MRKFRSAAVPVLVLAVLTALAIVVLNLPVIAHFDFIWDVLLGVALGAGLALLPTLSGYPAKKNAMTGMFWVCGFTALLVIFYQYMTFVTGLRLEALDFLAMPGTRMRVVEGALLGYSVTVAGRGKI